MPRTLHRTPTAIWTVIAMTTTTRQPIMFFIGIVTTILIIVTLSATTVTAADMGAVVFRTRDQASQVPIAIGSNTEFDAAHGVTGGNGTAEAPYLISNLSIDGGADAICISIQNTTAHFTISSCTLNNATTGIHLANCTNGTIAETAIRDATQTGIVLEHVNDITLTSSRVENCTGGGIVLNASSANTMTNTTLLSNGGYGIAIYNQTGAANLLYANCFVANAETLLSAESQAYNAGANNWSIDGTGNYWHDHHSRYPTADHDGVHWSIPYVLDGSRSDRHPLVYAPCDTTPPLARAGDDLFAVAPANITLDGGASTDETGITNWTWAVPGLGSNGSVAHFSGETVELAFTAENVGWYHCTLTVRDAGNHEANDTLWINVTRSDTLIADAGANRTAPQHTTVHFNASASRGPAPFVNWSWSAVINDTIQYRYGERVNYSFPRIDSYPVRLTVKDREGNVANTTVWVTITDSVAPTADAGNDRVIEQYETVILNGTNSTDNIGVINWTWRFDYGDGFILLYGRTPEFTFELAGTYTIRLVVEDAAGYVDNDIVIIRITDREPPVADAGADQTVVQHTEVKFDGTGCTDNLGLANWTWTFQYNNRTVRVYGIRATFTFHHAGSYHVRLTVRDTVGLTANDTVWINVTDIEPPTIVHPTLYNISQSHPSVLNASRCSDNVAIVNYSWMLANGGESITRYGEAPHFVFDAVGVYNVTLTLEDAAGNENATRITVIVHDSTPPHPDPGEDAPLTYGHVHYFNGAGSYDNIGITNYTWSFAYEGGTVHLYGIAPSFRFEEPGDYPVVLTVADAAGNSANDIIWVNVTGPQIGDLAGTVRTPSCEPLSVVTVDLVARDQQTFTGIDGRFLFADLEVGTYTLSISKSGYGTVNLTDVEVGGGRRTTVNLTLVERTVTVSFGPIVDPDGDPLEGVTVSLTYKNRSVITTTGADGHARFDSVPEPWLSNRVRLQFNMSGYTVVNMTKLLERDARILFSPGELTLGDPQETGDDAEADSGTMRTVAIIMLVIIVVLFLLVIITRQQNGDGDEYRPRDFTERAEPFETEEVTDLEDELDLESEEALGDVLDEVALIEDE